MLNPNYRETYLHFIFFFRDKSYCVKNPIYFKEFETNINK